MAAISRGTLTDRAGPFRALEHRFEVLSDVPGAVGVVGRLFAPFEDEDAGGLPTVYELRRSQVGRPYAILSDGDLLHTAVDAGNTLDWLITEVGRRAIASAHPFVVLHAGVVSYRGGGILMPAPADHGKSTLTTALVRAGCAFLSDEAAPIDPRTRIVQPFPRPIVLSPSSLAVFPGLAEALPAEHTTFRNYQFHLTCDDIRAGSMGGPCSVDVIVTPRYEPGAATALEPLSAADCLITLVTQCLNFDRVGASSVPLLANVVEGAACYQLTTGKASTAVGAILGLIE
jgi:hypothetical protein